MIRAMIRRLLRHQGKLFLAALLGLALFEVLIIWFASQIEQGPGLRTLFEQLLPAGLRQILAARVAMASFSGAVAFGFQHPFVLVAAVAFIMVVATIPAGERESGLLDLILARPVPRWRYLAAILVLLLAAAVLLPLALVGGAAVGLALVEVEGQLPWHRYLPAAAGLSTLLLAVGGYTLLLATGARRRGPAVAQATGLTLAFYVIEFLAELLPALARVRWISPFHYFRPIPAAVLSETPPQDPLVLLGIFLAASTLAFLHFHRQDL